MVVTIDYLDNDQYQTRTIGIRGNARMTANAIQVAAWNGPAGKSWVQHQDQIERCSSNAAAELLRHAVPQSGEAVLDVGCGTGRFTRDIAHIVGPEGEVVGIDISAPMLDKARADSNRTNVKFVGADASSHNFPPTFDLVISRFGTMFFDDPIAAFRNLATAMNRKGRIAFICFRGMAENEFAMVPYEATKSLFPARPPSDPYAPGSFAFADPNRVAAILGDAGFRDVEITPVDCVMRLGSLEEAAFLATFVVGPTSRALETANDDLRDRAFEMIKSALERHASKDGVNLGMACWLVKGR